MSKKLTLDDIFNDDDFGLLETKPTVSNVKSDDDRLNDSFEEINVFVDKNNREPSATSMSEYSLMSKLKQIKMDNTKMQTLKAFDRHNLLGVVDIKVESLDDIIDDDNSGLLDSGEDLSIFEFNHTPKNQDRADTDFVARRKKLSNKEFSSYETKFHQVHKELKEGKRQFKEFKDGEMHLQEGQYYIADGVMLFLEKVDFSREGEGLSKNTTRRKDGRTRIIFENGTESKMYYRSLAKAIYNDGKMITNTDEEVERELFVNANLVKEEDVQKGWIYVLKSKSTNPQIAGIEHLYKIGYTSTSVDERIKNAKDEATYLCADVHKVATYSFYNRNADVLENLLHRFFGKACLNVDLFDHNDQRITPREWFVVPFTVIDEAIQLIINEKIIDYVYDKEKQVIKLK